jgi:hypothetical protein
MSSENNNNHIAVYEKISSLSELELLNNQNIFTELAAEINHLILHDFQKLVHLLYRIDVSESKLTSLLKDYPGEDAGRMIAALIIERQIQKVISRKQQKTDESSDEERW